jgi:hypothetical protein
LQQAIKFKPWSFAVAGAFARPEVEAWLICTATQSEDRHRRCVADLRKDLGFDPTEQSHRLSSTSSSSKKDAKNVRRRMREAGMDTDHSFKSSSVDELRQRGASNGLAAYLDDLDKALGPHLGAPR